MTEKYTEDKRLLGALDYIDEKFIAEVTEDYEVFDYVGKPTRKMRFRIARQYLIYAACLVLLACAMPIVSYIVPQIGELFGGNAGNIGDTETIDMSEFADMSERDLIEHIGEVPEEFKAVIENNVFKQCHSTGDYVYVVSEDDIIVYDKYGNIVDDIDFESGNIGTCLIYKLSDGDYIKTRAFDAYYQIVDGIGKEVKIKASVEKFTTDGKIVFSTEFDLMGGLDFVGEVDDGYIISGIPQNWLGNDTQCFYIYKLDKSGNILHQRRIGSNNIAGIIKAECVDGELILYDRHVKGIKGKECEYGYCINYLNDDLSPRKTVESTEPIDECISYSFSLSGSHVFWSIERFISDFDAGYVSSVIYYDDFILIISERDTKWFEYVPMVYSSMPSYTETVYTAYTYDAEIIWRSAVDSTDYERLAEIKKEYEEEQERFKK